MNFCRLDKMRSVRGQMLYIQIQPSLKTKQGMALISLPVEEVAVESAL